MNVSLTRHREVVDGRVYKFCGHGGQLWFARDDSGDELSNTEDDNIYEMKAYFLSFIKFSIIILYFIIKEKLIQTFFNNILFADDICLVNIFLNLNEYPNIFEAA